MKKIILWAISFVLFIGLIIFGNYIFDKINAYIGVFVITISVIGAILTLLGLVVVLVMYFEDEALL